MRDTLRDTQVLMDNGHDEKFMQYASKFLCGYSFIILEYK